MNKLDIAQLAQFFRDGVACTTSRAGVRVTTARDVYLHHQGDNIAFCNVRGAAAYVSMSGALSFERAQLISAVIHAFGADPDKMPCIDLWSLYAVADGEVNRVEGLPMPSQPA